MSKPRRRRIRLLAAERSELERRVAARTASQQDAYRAQIILRVANGQTDAAIGRDMGLAERTVWLWRHRFAEHRLDGLKDRPKCPPSRQYHADIQARVLVLACQKPAEVDPQCIGQAIRPARSSGAGGTSSTSFANPAVTLARMLSDTFAGIAPASVPGFVVAQLLGAVVACGLIRVLKPGVETVAQDVVVTHEAVHGQPATAAER